MDPPRLLTARAFSLRLDQPKLSLKQLAAIRHGLVGDDQHHRAVAVVDSFAPVRAVLSIDEMDCELTGRWRDPERAMKIARDGRRRVLTALAPRCGRVDARGLG